MNTPRRQILPFLLPLALLGTLLLSSCQLDFKVPENPGNRYALVIGIADYQSTEINDLVQTIPDANTLAAVLESGPRSWNVKKLLNSQATQENIRNEILKLSQDPDATILVYYSGHGMGDISSVETDEVWLVPYDANFNSIDSFITPAKLTNWMGGVEARNRVLILDSCYSGGFALRDDAIDTLPPNYLKVKGLSEDIYFVSPNWETFKQMIDAQFRILGKLLNNISSIISRNIAKYGTADVSVLTAAGSGEESLESSILKHGVFTYYLLKSSEDNDGDSYSDGDTDHDGIVTLDEAYRFTKSKLLLNWNWRTFSTYQYLSVDSFVPHISGGTGDVALF